LEQFAAIDLGSNSFHMKVAHAEEHGITVIDRERDMVRLAAGLDASGLLTPEASERALGCLARFGERLRGLKPDNVRIVGTNALRKAKNSREFIAKAEQALGFSIEIISGIEEARLVYLGAAQSLQGDRGRRLVVDIGGGSTEIIVADKSDPVFLESLYNQSPAHAACHPERTPGAGTSYRGPEGTIGERHNRHFGHSTCDQ
jgi:exopolyphosphatase/guanosine-5'-triphosphate,3'-diphosphate pyrophosphatase